MNKNIVFNKEQKDLKQKKLHFCFPLNQQLFPTKYSAYFLEMTEIKKEKRKKYKL